MSCVGLTSGRIASSSWRTRRSAHTSRYLRPMRGRTRRSVRRRSVASGANEATRKHPMTRSRSTRPASPIPTRCSAQRARQETVPSGGDALGASRATPCARLAGGLLLTLTCTRSLDRANYRKYGVISFVKSEDAKKPEKKEAGVGGKKGKGAAVDGSNSGASTPAPAPQAPKLPPCACCRRMEPKSMMARCKTCTFAVHAGECGRYEAGVELTETGCYGITSEQLGKSWECDLCANARLEENHLVRQLGILFKV